MKKLAFIMALLASIGMNAFAQDGYVLFNTGSRTVYDEFTTPGTGVLSPGNVEVTFLWALTGTPDPLGSGVPTSGVTYTANNWNTISSMISSGWDVAEDAGNGNVEADVAAIASGVLKGHAIYNSGNSFQLANTTGGDTYQLVVIGWDNLTGANTLEQGMTGVVPVGWSSSFDYWTGAQVIDPTLTFNQSGMVPFGVAADPVPEPATLALAGLGGLATFFLRRRIS